MDKKERRQFAIQKLKELARHEKLKNKKEKQILALFFASKQWKEAQSVAVVKAVDFEFDTSKVMRQAFLEGKKVLVPKSLPERRLAFYEVDTQTEYTTTKFGVEEPLSNLFLPKDEIDLIVVPGLLFSSRGFRIGFGGGFYDRYLADYQGKTCSLVFSEQLYDDWEVEEFDIPVQKIYTDSYKGGAVNE
ncbi:5-formyltetrahydrofolate cyclo-ligase [Enterococcus lemanii]|uniref:5-formyltetrahydrofolate cyclo-ligase n=1 Tax=Enterococcus lemanii TaxID=1159752 RepID=A0ABV9MVH7_9ENTE|nr:5-formyltetrahydrofolate cyclo-ligase [Enterococcus lemanii]MBM7708336.1 5-formyltetrahydrofolate cyclo-ligase [Enterococcus lemanii]